MVKDLHHEEIVVKMEVRNIKIKDEKITIGIKNEKIKIEEVKVDVKNEIKVKDEVIKMDDDFL